MDEPDDGEGFPWVGVLASAFVLAAIGYFALTQIVARPAAASPEVSDRIGASEPAPEAPE